jgi:hypothetical protein
LQVAGILGAGMGAYAAIRSDLGRLGAEVKSAAASADKAHSRIDQLMKKG